MLRYLSNVSIFVISFVYSLGILCPIFVYAADNNDTLNTDDYVPLANGFFNVELGFTFDEVVARLKQEVLLVVLEEPEIFVIPERKQKVIRTEGSKDDSTGYQFIREAFFHFNDENILVMLVMSLNTNIIDYFTVFDIHDKKYGNASVINPNKAQWNGNMATLIIERPLVIKYIMNGFVSAEQDKNNNIDQQIRKEYREEFLSLF